MGYGDYSSDSGPSSPIDLSALITNGNICSLKCSYSFTYAPTNLQIKNQGTYLSLQVDATTAPPVIYNDQNYNVQEVRLYQPSLHTYAGGTHADAELIIAHTNNMSTKKLMVCIPIKQSSTSTSDSTYFFDKLLTEVQNTANSQGQQTVYDNPTFSLAKFVPMTPYYSYNGTLPWQPFNDVYDYIVFKIEDAIHMSTEAYKVFQAVTVNSNIVTVTNPYDVFYNSAGPVPANKGEIYIDCQPTGDDGEILVPAKIDAGGLLQNNVLQKLFNYTLVKIFIGALIMLIIWKLAMKVINGIAEHSAKAASFVINNATKVDI
jgi:carbonic anhydrase